MKTSTQKINSNQVQLNIELEKPDLDRYLRETESKLTRNLQVDGFRKGKAPNDLVRKHTDPSLVNREATGLALEKSLAQALEEQNLDAIEVSKLEIKESSSSQLSYSVLATLYPAVDLASLRKIKVQRKDVSVQAKEVDDTLATIQSSRSKLIDKNEPAMIGDRVEVDFEVSKDDKIIDGGVSKNHPLIIGQKNFIPGFEEALVGMNKGDEKNFSLTAPDDYFHKEVAGKKLNFKIKMIDIKQVIKPELTDEFAKSLGNFQNMEQLVLNIKEGLLVEKREKENERVRLEALNKIIEVSDVNLPETMVNDQLNRMIQNFDEDLHRQDLELSLYLARIGKTQDDFKKEWRPEAERQVKMALVIHKIGRAKNITVDPSEVEEKVNALLQAAAAQNPAGPASIDISSLRSRVLSQLMNQRTLEFIEGVCVK